MSADEKTCAHCATVFTRAAHRKPSAFAKRRFCTRQCGAMAAAADPAWRKRVSDNTRAKFAADPDFAARHAAAARVNLAAGRILSDRAKSGRTRSRNILGWLRPDDRPAYIRMREQYGAAEAKRMMQEADIVAGKRQVAQIALEQRQRHKRDLASRY